jgi:hypothetical protein
MFPLDDRTVERLAKAIVDIGGPYERMSYRLPELLIGAGWSDPPEYDGSPRVPWLVDQMTLRRDNHEDIERLLCRVCDPLEYDDGMADAEEFRKRCNTILAPEQLTISYVGGRPVLSGVAPDGQHPRFAAPENIERRLRRLILDEGAVDLLMRRVQETLLCEDVGAHTMAIIGIGSFVEGLLYTVITERDVDIREHGFPGQNGHRTPASRATLEALINDAHARDWIQLDAKDFMHNVRQYRNFVHPRLELERQPQFDRDSVTLCWAPVHALLNDLEQRIAVGPSAEDA